MPRTTTTTARFVRAVAVTGAIAVAVVGVALIVRAATGPVDSPVDVAGGSVYGRINNLLNWFKSSDGSLYWAPSNNKELLTFHGLVDAQRQPQPDFSIQNTGGWEILFSTYKAARQGKYDHTIAFCSDVNTEFSGYLPHCTGTASTNLHAVYLQYKTDARWQPRRFSHRLHFHDRACDGDTDNESDCDMISAIDIITRNHDPRSGQYTCSNEKDCWVKAGK